MNSCEPPFLTCHLAPAVRNNNTLAPHLSSKMTTGLLIIINDVTWNGSILYYLYYAGPLSCIFGCTILTSPFVLMVCMLHPHMSREGASNDVIVFRPFSVHLLSWERASEKTSSRYSPEA